LLKDEIASHVVSEITWGSRNIVTVRQAMSWDDDVSVVTGNINARLKSFSTGAGGELVKDSAQSVLDNSLEVSVEGDVVATDGSIPTNLSSAEAFISNVPNYIKAVNEGKGKPLIILTIVALRPGASAQGADRETNRPPRA
jgi:hypothetical protein